jgi:pilus assembly protein Flp/PilA
MKNLASRFVSDESGATAIEYGLIAAIVGVGIIVSLGTLKDALVADFDASSAAMNGAN